MGEKKNIRVIHTFSQTVLFVFYNANVDRELKWTFNEFACTIPVI
jgi:hypothetical protein